MRFFYVHTPSGYLGVHATRARVEPDGSLAFTSKWLFGRRETVLLLAAGAWSACHIGGKYAYHYNGDLIVDPNAIHRLVSKKEVRDA